MDITSKICNMHPLHNFYKYRLHINILHYHSNSNNIIKIKLYSITLTIM